MIDRPTTLGGAVGAPADGLVERVCAAASGVRGDVRAVVELQVDRLAPLATDAERSAVIVAAIARLSGLDAIERYLDDPEVDEVMVNTGGEIWTDRSGNLRHHGRLPSGVIDMVLERVLAPTGKRLDRTSPIVDLRLGDGSRLCAVVDPVAVDGTTVAIRRHRRRHVAIDAFVGDRTTAALLRELLVARCNVLIAGSTSSGKTTLLASMLAELERTERLVVCEDTTELELERQHVVRLEARSAAADGGATVDLAALVRTALRLRPDRLVVGEFRGVEVLAAIEAMNTGHDGSMSTCHANSCADALRRVETLLMQAAPTWPLPAIRRQVSRSIDIVVHVERGADGARRIVEIAETVEGDGEPTLRLLSGRHGLVAPLRRHRRSGR